MSKAKKKVGKIVLRIILIILLILVLLAGGGFLYLYFHGMSGMQQIDEPTDDQIKVACVGDSITYGHGITNWPKNNYPAVLQNLLDDTYHVNNYGVSGEAVQQHSDRPYTALPTYQECLDYDADYVVFMMGTNDSKPQNWKDAATYRADLEALLDSFGDAEIILCTPCTSFFLKGQTEGTTNFDIQPLIVDEIADVVRDVAAQRGYTLVDIHALTASHPEWYAKDGVHPNNDGAAAIAEEISKAIQK